MKYFLGAAVGIALMLIIGGIYLWSTKSQTQIVSPVQTIPNETTSVGSCTYSTIDPDTVLIELNDYRISQNLPQLLTDTTLQDYAQLRADEMFLNNSTTHKSVYVNFSTWAKAHKRNTTVAISVEWEDVIGSQTNPCGTILSFLNSPTHAATFNDPKALLVGVGYASGFVAIEIGDK